MKIILWMILEKFLEELKTVCMKRKSEMKRTEKNRVTERERERERDRERERREKRENEFLFFLIV